MSRIRPPRDRGIGWGFTVSILLHLSLTAVVFFYRHSPPTPLEAPVYYVDVVNLPVASPREGSPLTAPPQPAPPPSPASPAEMKLPGRESRTSITPRERTPSRTEDAEKSFEERMAKLQQAIEERRHEAAIEALRRKAAGSIHPPERVGTPGGTGTETGSDYASYIQSRLTDAFQHTIAHQSKSPEVVVRLTIDPSGRISRKRIERSTGDRLFEESVLKAINRAERAFVPPPGGGEFEHGFIFRPQGVGKK